LEQDSVIKKLPKHFNEKSLLPTLNAESRGILYARKTDYLILPEESIVKVVEFEFKV
jgi:hypothetical protein|tara:strand:+ start:301 stop:471 length:171 start_codon:yes stop_codon:yes gene_type:complete